MNRSKCSNSYTNKSSESNWGVHRYANNFDLFEYGEASMDGLTVLLLYIQFFFYNLLFKISTNRNLQVWNWSIIGVPFPLHETCIEISFDFVYFFLSLSLSLGSLFKIEITYPNCNANQMKSWLVLFSYHFLFHCLLFETYRTASTNSEDVLVFFVAIIWNSFAISLVLAETCAHKSEHWIKTTEQCKWSHWNA